MIVTKPINVSGLKEQMCYFLLMLHFYHGLLEVLWWRKGALLIVVTQGSLRTSGWQSNHHLEHLQSQRQKERKHLTQAIKCSGSLALK